MRTSLTSYSDALYYTRPWTSVHLVHVEMADSEAIFTPSMLSWAMPTFSRILKTTNFVHSLHGHSSPPSFEFLPLQMMLVRLREAQPFLLL